MKTTTYTRKPVSSILGYFTTLILIVLMTIVVVGCGGEINSLEEFAISSCDIYMDGHCDYEYWDSINDCEEYTIRIFTKNIPVNEELCYSCLLSLDCKMWEFTSECNDYCKSDNSKSAEE